MSEAATSSRSAGLGSPSLAEAGWVLLALVVLRLVAGGDGSLLHGLTELLGAGLAFAAAILALHAGARISNAFVRFVALACVAIGSLDLLHAVTSEGPALLADQGRRAGLSWLAARFIEGGVLLAGHAWLAGRRDFPNWRVLGAWLLAAALLATAILRSHSMPALYVAGRGTTAIGLAAAWVTALLEALAVVLLFARRRWFEPASWQALIGAAALWLVASLGQMVLDGGPLGHGGGDAWLLARLAGWYLACRAVVAAETGDRAASESLFQVMANTAPVLIWISGLDKLCYWFNERWLAFTGRTMEQESGNGWAEGVHPDDLQRCIDIYVGCFDRREPFAMEYRLRRYDGQYRWILDTGVPRHDASGAFLGYIGSCVDIDDRKQAESRLAATLREQEGILQSEIVGFMVVRDRKVEWVNSAYTRMLGYAPGQIVGQSTRIMYLDDESYRRFPGEAYPLITAGRTYRAQWQIRRADGTVGWFDLSGAALGGGEGRSLWAYVDITEQKAGDAERNRLLAIIKEAPDFIAMSDMESRLTYINPAGARLVGLPEDVDFTTLRIADMHPEWATRKVLGEGLTTALAEGAWHGETALLHRDGHELPVSQMLLMHRDEAGRPERLSTIMRDISQRKRSEQDLHRAKEAAEASNRAKSQFLATMSHEIRTPLNAVMGMAQLLMAPQVGEAQRLSQARTILGSSQQLLELLSDILDVSKVESGRLELERVGFSPQALLQQAVDLYARGARDKGIAITCSATLPGDGLYVGDPHRISQMLANLASNGIKFTERGSIALRARELARDGNGALLEFSVTDTGIGIEPGKIPLLFQPFTQADSSMTRRFGGTGLGLSIVRRLARMMGGEAGVHSRVDEGSRFWFTVRLEVAGAAGAATRAGAGPAAQAPSPAGLPDALPVPHRRLLVVEDDPASRQVMAAWGERHGHEVAFADEGAGCLAALATLPRPDLVLMDIHLPGMDGYATAQAIRALEASHGWPRTPILALSADVASDVPGRCQAAGMQGALRKPVHFGELQAAVLEHTGRAPEPAAPAAGASPAPTPAVDGEAIMRLAGALVPLLEEHKFRALAAFRELAMRAAGTPWADGLDELEVAVDGYQFEQALALLRAWLARRTGGSAAA